MVKVPCFKCEDRTDSCHSACKKYADYKEELMKERRYNSKMRPSVLRKTSFTGTSPKPGKPRHTRT